ncbi:2-amino-4-hydroxy-6-hydroxymethyldihydropteridine diphosphokinase [Pseudogemmobacter sp. W21_MBD1_M6]|uniref:2-amino-4-hydroxy-6- hydroxymethyldihydropteridine diphosphokinase n=1 Tax=Pseudogemmobacter sp. W21_MBD1_M6 TaxID=3240271 RepID=UPI003F996B0B
MLQDGKEKLTCSKGQVTFPKVWVAMGGNTTSDVGGPEKTIAAALEQMQTDSFFLVSTSKYYRNPCFPKGAGPDYVNAVAGFRTSMSPQEVLAHLHRVEAAFGRERVQRWGMRTLDLDLLAYDDAVLPDLATYQMWQNLALEIQKTDAPDQLILPHPRLHERAFVLVPFLDVAPDWVHPVLNRTVAQLAAALPAEDIAEVVPL